MEKEELQAKALGTYQRMRRLDPHVRSPGAYEEWIEAEGIPIHEALVGVTDLRELPRDAWARVGGHGTLIQLLSLYQCEKGLFVVEIPGGKALNPERNLYETFYYVMQGRGALELGYEGQSKATFEWGEGSIFAVPLNVPHRLLNGSSEPALLLGLNTAPRVMNALHDSEVVFNCDYQFLSQFGGEGDYFSRNARHDQGDRGKQLVWLTNFIPDVRIFGVEKGTERKAKGGESAQWWMGSNWPKGGISQWPVGHYHAAHRHEAGAIVLGITGKGYVLVWSHEFGSRPYEAGNGDKVERMDWGAYSIYTPPDNWYHQHFNTDGKPARQVKVHNGINRNPVIDFGDFVDRPTMVSEAEGGLLIPYPDEDPQIRIDFEAELAKDGIECEMPLLAVPAL